MAALLAAVLITALLAALAQHVHSVQDALGAELTRRDADTALALAALAAPVQQDGAAVQALASALMQNNAYREVMVRTGPGVVVFARSNLAEEPAQDAPPVWFSQAFPLVTQAGHAALPATAMSAAALSLAGSSIGVVRVQSSTAAAQAALWRSSTELAWSLLLLGASAAAAAALLLSRWRRSLAQVSARTHAVANGQRLQGLEPAPPWPELRQITQALDHMEQRADELFASQAEQLAHLQLRAHTDPVTGLALRQTFMGRLQDAMAHGHSPAAGLLLLRVVDLQEVNHQHGHETTDRMLRVLADLLLTYVERVPGTMAGRLNGCDFALYLPAPGVTHETAQSIEAALKATPSARLPGLRILLGGCESVAGTTASAALATADAALARAEAGEALVVLQPEPLLGGGARAWHDCIAHALERPVPATGITSGVRLACYPVVDEAGSLVHLECLMRLQARPQGEWLRAQSWLALAQRCGLMHRVDWAALDLALEACALDHKPRCVHVSLHSFADAEFAPGMLARLRASGTQARLLSIEWSEALDTHAQMRAELRASLGQAVAQWRALGVRVGVEHAGSTPKALPALRDIGAQYVKVDARHVRGAASDPAVHRYAASLVSLIQGLGMSAMAQGVDSADDLDALRALGFDGFTGPAVLLHDAPAQAAQAAEPLTDSAFVESENVSLAVGEEQPQRLAHGAERELVPRHFVFLEQPRLKGLRPWV
jgi:predicted signal transduction protein with EAL and GGDEF domain